MRVLVLCVLVLALAVPVVAQDAPTAYEFRIYAAGATAPMQTTPIPLSIVTCNATRPPIPTGAASNPTTAWFADPAVVGKDCWFRLDTPPPGPIFALPSGAYLGALVAINGEGATGESNRDPFSRVRLPAVPTGVRLIR